MTNRTLTWTEVCALPWLKDIPAKIETNGHNKIMMSPASAWHGGFESDIGILLHQHKPGGRIIMECPIETSDGTRVADVAWISRERYLPYRRAVSLPVAPEICVEVISPSNSREEMLQKMNLYYAAGAQEVWLCDDDGHMEFFVKGSVEPVLHSVLCPGFPRSVDTFDA